MASCEARALALRLMKSGEGNDFARGGKGNDNDPKTAPKATRDVNENELRKGLGLPPREKYHFGEAVGDGQRPEHDGHYHE